MNTTADSRPKYVPQPVAVTERTEDLARALAQALANLNPLSQIPASKASKLMMLDMATGDFASEIWAATKRDIESIQALTGAATALLGDLKGIGQ